MNGMNDRKVIYLDDAIDAIEYWHGIDASEALGRLPSAQEEKWISEIREAYERAKANPYIRKPLSRALYEVWHRYDQTEVERR